MKWTPVQVTSAVLLLIITGALVAWLPRAEAFAGLAQIAVAAAKGALGS